MARSCTLCHVKYLTWPASWTPATLIDLILTMPLAKYAGPNHNLYWSSSFSFRSSVVNNWWRWPGGRTHIAPSKIGCGSGSVHKGVRLESGRCCTWQRKTAGEGGSGSISSRQVRKNHDGVKEVGGVLFEGFSRWLFQGFAGWISIDRSVRTLSVI